MTDFTLNEQRQTLLDASLEWALSPRTRDDEIQFQNVLRAAGFSTVEIMAELRELQIKASEKLNGRRYA